MPASLKAPIAVKCAAPIRFSLANFVSVETTSSPVSKTRTVSLFNFLLLIERSSLSLPAKNPDERTRSQRSQAEAGRGASHGLPLRALSLARQFAFGITVMPHQR